MGFAEIMWVGVECDTKIFSSIAVISAGVCKEGMALARNGFCKELTEVAEAYDGDLERFGVEVLGLEFGLVDGVNGANAERGRKETKRGGSGGIERERKREGEGNGMEGRGKKGRKTKEKRRGNWGCARKWKHC